MANPAVTYTFVNATTADATQVNKNFQDIIDALTDGTKSFSIDALTCAGTFTANGAINLGNASTDDLTILGSLAGSIPIKTNNSYDIGSATLGLAGLYLGAPSSRSTRLRAHQSLSSSNTLIFPNGNGNADDILATDGSGNMSWVADKKSPMDIMNFSLGCAVAANALTVTLKGADGNDLSATNFSVICFRHATSATGTPVEVKITSNLTITVSSGSTLGHTSAKEHYAYLYLINNAGTAELAISSSVFDEGSVLTTTAEGGGGAADSLTTIYSTTARSNVAVRLIGRITSTQSTAGTWATAISEVSIGNRFESEGVPAGAVQLFAGAVVPYGWLSCDGTAVSRTTYARLFRAIGTTWGTGDGSTTFNVPDFRGVFLRGAGTHGSQAMAAGGNYAGGALGTFTADAFQGHYHTISSNTLVDSTGNVPTDAGGTYSTGRSDVFALVTTPITDGTNGTPRTSTETRPGAYGINMIIKT